MEGMTVDRYLMLYYRAGRLEGEKSPRDLPEHDPGFRPVLLDELMDQSHRKLVYKRPHLLSLPAEILADIVEYLGLSLVSNLSQLALVNSYCRALAYSLRFRVLVVEKPTLLSLRMLGSYNPEWPRLRYTFNACLIAQCVRKVIFQPTYDYTLVSRKIVSRITHSLFRHRRVVNWWYTSRGPMPPEVRPFGEMAVLARRGYNHWINHATCQLGLVLDALTQMPKLVSLQCPGVELQVCTQLLCRLLYSNVQNLELRNIQVGATEVEGAATWSWIPTHLPFRKLSLDIKPEYVSQPENVDDQQQERQISSMMNTLYATILQRCGSTLESLEWTTNHFGGEPVSINPEYLSFPSLQCLMFKTPLGSSIVDHDITDKTVLAILRGSPRLAHLLLHRLMDPELLLHGADGQPFRQYNLKSLHLRRGAFFNVSHARAYMLWIRAHHTLEQLAIDAVPHDILNGSVIPMLFVKAFTNLTSLRLHWTKRVKEDGYPVEGQQVGLSDSSFSILRRGSFASLRHLSIGPD